MSFLARPKGYAERQSVGKLMQAIADIDDMKKIDSFIENEIGSRCMKQMQERKI